MAIQFEFYKNPQQDEEKEINYHPRVVNFQHVTTQRLAAEIHSATTFGRAEVEAMLMELSRCMGNHLQEGERVHLDGIGYFQVTLQATEPIHSISTRSNKVKIKTVSFQPDKDLKGTFVHAHVHRSKLKPHSESLSEEEIDRRLTTYFATHLVLRRTDMQSLCGFTESMASRQIRRLKALKKLENIGRSTQPIYVPGKGYYER
ncbi:HU family DNA-binding protein [Bacteroides sp.]|uniref:HU family DNA-binding protein n=1 Tax=Bacteroides sp. TaxID=29523 RepID=UPI00260637A6|nr:HU family DNA-binding protein [Bacteroides sp.]MDD3036332.1 HU family DNA-binding protein [Bacteroides sp.]